MFTRKRKTQGPTGKAPPGPNRRRPAAGDVELVHAKLRSEQVLTVDDDPYYGADPYNSRGKG